MSTEPNQPMPRPAAPATVGWRLIVALAALLWERVWPNLWPALALALIYLSASLFDLWAVTPGWLHLVVLVAFALGVIGALGHGIWRIVLPLREQAKRRLEQESGLRHRPLTTIDDRLAGGTDDAASRALWEEHHRRTRQSLNRLHVGWPRAGLARGADPWGLRVIVALIVVVAFAAARDDAPRRVALAFVPDFASLGSGSDVTIDAWIAPPDYTGRPPIFLQLQTAGNDPQVINVPTGSVLFARVHGGRGLPELLLDEEPTPFVAVDQSNFEVEQPLTAGQTIRFEQRSRAIAEWSIKIVPDRHPAIRFNDEPVATVRQALRLDFAASDDYGVATAQAHIRRADSDESMALDLPLPQRERTDVSETSFHDLTPHPWAGLPVIMHLEAVDQADCKSGSSSEIEFILPERDFQAPGGHARVVEQRRVLALAPDRRDRVAQSLSRLSARPGAYLRGHHRLSLALRSAVWRLRNVAPSAGSRPRNQRPPVANRPAHRGRHAVARRAGVARRPRPLDGGLSPTPTPPTPKSAQRIQEVRDALEKFLQALAERALQNQQAGDSRRAPARPVPRAGPTAAAARPSPAPQRIRRSRDAARDLSLPAARTPRIACATAERRQPARRCHCAGEEMLRDLNELLRLQQELLDPHLPGIPARRTRPTTARSGKLVRLARAKATQPSLAERQEELRRRLGEMMRRLGEQGVRTFPGAPGPRGTLDGQRPRAARGAPPRRRRRPDDRCARPAPPRARIRSSATCSRRWAPTPASTTGPTPSPAIGRDPFGRPQNGFGILDDSRVEIPDRDSTSSGPAKSCANSTGAPAIAVARKSSWITSIGCYGAFRPPAAGGGRPPRQVPPASAVWRRSRRRFSPNRGRGPVRRQNP